MDLNISQFGWIHTALSLVALVTGIFVVAGLIGSRRNSGVTLVFLLSAIATSATAFGFAGSIDPAKIIGIISLVLLTVAVLAHYIFGRAGVWQRVYAVAAVLSVYFLVFVTIAEAFKRVPALKALAPTLTETPFKIAQLVALVVFVVMAIIAAVRFGSTSADDVRA